VLSGEAARLGVKNVQQSVQRENEAVDLSICCGNEKSSKNLEPERFTRSTVFYVTLRFCAIWHAVGRRAYWAAS
jgi:hypothetical protein